MFMSPTLGAPILGLGLSPPGKTDDLIECLLPRQPPPPPLPQEIVEKTAARYEEAAQRLTA